MSAALRTVLRAQGGALAEHSVEPANRPRQRPGPPQRAAAGPRAAGRETDYELPLEMILEGSRLHYGSPTVVQPDDPDLRLLLGDQLYALGLSRLAALGDLDAIVELADVISLVAQAQAVSDAELADAVWDAGAVAIGWGTTATLAEAKALARAENQGAARALRRAARESARRLG